MFISLFFSFNSSLSKINEISLKVKIIKLNAVNIIYVIPKTKVINTETLSFSSYFNDFLRLTSLKVEMLLNGVLLLCTSFQFWIQWYHGGSWKTAMVKVLKTWKSSNTIIKFNLLSCWFFFRIKKIRKKMIIIKIKLKSVPCLVIKLKEVRSCTKYDNCTLHITFNDNQNYRENNYRISMQSHLLNHGWMVP